VDVAACIFVKIKAMFLGTKSFNKSFFKLKVDKCPTQAERKEAVISKLAKVWKPPEKQSQ
jgi:hypothetical protein